MPRQSQFKRELQKLLPREARWNALVDTNEELILRAAMRNMRRRLRKGAGVSTRDHNTLKARDRFARKKARQFFKALKKKPHYRLDIVDKGRLVSRYNQCTILEALHPTREDDWIPITKRIRRKGYATLSFRSFSFLDDPNNALKILRALSVLECSEITAYVNFEDDYIEDIGSYLVLSEVWPAIREFAMGGRMPLPVQRVLYEMGMGSELKIRLTGAEAIRTGQGIWTMPVQRRRPLAQPRSREALIPPQGSDIAATRFGELVNRWLRIDAIQAELTDKGLGKLKGIFGELLDNAVRHSIAHSRDGNWSMAAFMARRKIEGSKTDQYVCRIAVLSPGQSIAETFESAPTQIAQFAEMYAGGHENSRQSKATLKTLLAIQDMITTDPDAFLEEEGGTGLMETINFFNALAAIDNPLIAPKMTIVSGSSCVMLRPPYMAGLTDPNWSKDGAPPRQLWCNAKNTRQEPPDPDFVFDLNERLAGTLITMGFTLDAEWIRSALSIDDGEPSDD